MIPLCASLSFVPYGISLTYSFLSCRVFHSPNVRCSAIEWKPDDCNMFLVAFEVTHGSPPLEVIGSSLVIAFIPVMQLAYLHDNLTSFSLSLLSAVGYEAPEGSSKKNWWYKW